MHYIIDGHAIHFEKGRADWKTWIIWRLASENISESKYRKIRDFILKK